MNQYEKNYIGCSAEGHVSHILSARLSSRPLGWSRTGLDQMARLRVFVANGGEVYQLFMKKKKEEANEAREIKIDREIIRRRKLSASTEKLGNLPMLNIGQRSTATRFLLSVRGF